MNLPELVQTVLDNRTITPALEEEINSLLWSQPLNQQELDALGQLIEALERGTVYSCPNAESPSYASIHG